MASHLATTFGFAIMGVILASVLGAVDRREKFAFVPGILLIVAGPTLVAVASVPEAVGGVIALLGVVAVVGSTVPLLRGSSAEA